YLTVADHERRPRSRSRDRHRERIDPYVRERKHRDDAGIYDRVKDELYRRGDRDHELEHEDRGRRDRDRDRDRRRRHDWREDHHRSRSRSRSASPRLTNQPASEAKPVDVDTPAPEVPDEPLTEEQQEMMRTLGFCNFDSTKGKHVIGNSIYVANVTKQHKYRQYMNRRGGFNRPLDPVG
ncbi:hypothetical protein P879_01456, partial [Paragonimus westermani]